MKIRRYTYIELQEDYRAVRYKSPLKDIFRGLKNFQPYLLDV